MKNLIFIFLFVILTGCNRSENLNTSIKNDIHAINIGDKTSLHKKSNYYVEEDKTNIEKFEEENKSVKDRNEYLTTKINEIKNIENSTVEIIGNITVVNIKTIGELNDSDLLKLKKEVEGKVKKFDKQIDHVSVSSSEKISMDILNNTD